MPANIVEVAEAMIVRGVEAGDLDYALELVMTSSAAREQGHQVPLMDVLLAAGARASASAIVMTLAHRELEPVAALLGRGLPLTAPIAAAFGRTEELPALLAAALPEERRAALAMAVINGRLEAARLALAAGADPNAFMPVHSHSLPLHQAALDGDLALIELLLARGARAEIPDLLWGGTPAGWAAHAGQSAARARLERGGAP
jgi:peptide-methionine (S)-S-oxide reductase